MIWNEATYSSDCFSISKGNAGGSYASYSGNDVKISFNASNSNILYGSSSVVQPKSMTTLYIIKADRSSWLDHSFY